MTKILLIALLGWVVWRLLAPAKTPRMKTPPQAPRVENVLACARCGIFVPEGETLADADGRRYCCAEHKKLGARI